MLEGVWIIVGTAKIFVKQNGDRIVEILDRHLGNRSGAAVFPLSLTASGKYFNAQDRFPDAGDRA